MADQMTETTAEKAEKLARTLSMGIKTRNVGTCERCGRGTSSGMNPYCSRCASIVAREIADDLAARASQPAEDGAEAEKRDAERWRALIGSTRIRFFGTAGPDDVNYAHFGGEFWTLPPGEPADKLRADCGIATQCNAEWLTRYADAARKNMAAAPGSEGTRDG